MTSEDKASAADIDVDVEPAEAPGDD